MWESPSDWTDKFFKQELEAHVPKVDDNALKSQFHGVADKVEFSGNPSVQRSIERSEFHVC